LAGVISIDARRSGLLQTEEAQPQNSNVNVLPARRQLALSAPGDDSRMRA
jgi:hypothetical protein